MIFWAVFCAFSFKVWKKYKYDLWKKKFWTNQKRCQKTQNFTLISNPLKKLLKNAPKKSYKQTSLTNMSKSEKSAYFRQVFANNFFWVHFFKPFITDSKSAWISAVFDTQIEFLRKNFFLALISTFLKLWLQMRRKRLKKRKIIFYECVLEFNYATIKGFA